MENTTKFAVALVVSIAILFAGIKAGQFISEVESVRIAKITAELELETLRTQNHRLRESLAACHGRPLTPEPLPQPRPRPGRPAGAVGASAPELEPTPARPQD